MENINFSSKCRFNIPNINLISFLLCTMLITGASQGSKLDPAFAKAGIAAVFSYFSRCLYVPSYFYITPNHMKAQLSFHEARGLSLKIVISFETLIILTELVQ